MVSFCVLTCANKWQQMIVNVQQTQRLYLVLAGGFSVCSNKICEPKMELLFICFIEKFAKYSAFNAQAKSAPKIF